MASLLPLKDACKVGEEKVKGRKENKDVEKEDLTEVKKVVSKSQLG